MKRQTDRQTENILYLQRLWNFYTPFYFHVNAAILLVTVCHAWVASDPAQIFDPSRLYEKDWYIYSWIYKGPIPSLEPSKHCPWCVTELEMLEE